VGREYRYLINIIQMNRTLSDYVYILFMWKGVHQIKLQPFRP
jgi:hypothetical protein